MTISLSLSLAIYHAARSSVQCKGIPHEVQNAYVSNSLPHSTGHYYTCNSGFAWLSGIIWGHVSQCLMHGNYSHILDVCEEGEARGVRLADRGGGGGLAVLA